MGYTDDTHQRVPRQVKCCKCSRQWLSRADPASRPRCYDCKNNRSPETKKSTEPLPARGRKLDPGSMVELAVTERRMPEEVTVPDGFDMELLGGIRVKSEIAADWEEEDQALAALLVRRMSRTHPCTPGLHVAGTPGCMHPGHVKDVAMMTDIFRKLGLPGGLGAVMLALDIKRKAREEEGREQREEAGTPDEDNVADDTQAPALAGMPD